MGKKIEVESPLVILHGDEMAQVAFEELLRTFVSSKLDIDLKEIDLSAENRLVTNGNAVTESIEALRKYGVGIKNAGITVNRAQLDDLLEKHPDIDESSLDPLATKSPNGAIRKGIGGNITREDIQFRNLRISRPEWVDRDIEVMTMDDGGIKDSFNELSRATGIIKLLFVGSSGDPEELHRREINKGDPLLLATNNIDDITDWAHRFFQRAIDEKRDIYLGLKDTVIPGYDGAMRSTIEKIYKSDYKQRVEQLGLNFYYELIDAQAARIVSNPPKRALWGVPDNTTGRKLFKLINQLKLHGIPPRSAHVSISRMSAGGGDQYGSYNAPAREDGIVKVVVDGEERHARRVKKGDPMLLMSNDRQAIKDWVSQVFRDASRKEKEVYFGLKREYMEYDEVFSNVITEVRRELAKQHTPPPSFMIMRPSSQLIKMITDPPRNALYPSQNLDGDIFSDISAALGGSLATASSIIESKEGTMLFEAPHGTAHDLYVRYQESNGKEAHFNPSALIYALGNALETLGEREANEELAEYAGRLKQALKDTVADGIVTADLKGKTTDPDSEKVVDMYGFIDALKERI
ncbi:isocitrate dehydrogenase, NADP-dependent [Marinobacter daqiaonensis]|uniref:Isocitrate dehydrogenase, NADP-dependent n=1 Tax=Marinobacter daqiaonensis TaxID=650891 RepID=A0A1I6GQ16_9GAMM|nr:isocitrate/isopropylmalate family dehydrogenase [Marinobacter daqiaonensis]SFR44216.1 isocitrate dehydrogenase, NADP-dependent [Marinobacter daqiaonensis]